ncbi:hypothetical protein P4679_26370 [Priestia megaterium]|uniref:hypothetical protein n=1 Tax=Priestia megaterium TaxID=1404 RepID=UPI002E1D8C9E|nr:hypothetical protein [Priestia megaterium]
MYCEKCKDSIDSIPGTFNAEVYNKDGEMTLTSVRFEACKQCGSFHYLKLNVDRNSISGVYPRKSAE